MTSQKLLKLGYKLITKWEIKEIKQSFISVYSCAWGRRWNGNLHKIENFKNLIELYQLYTETHFANLRRFVTIK